VSGDRDPDLGPGLLIDVAEPVPVEARQIDGGENLHRFPPLET